MSEVPTSRNFPASPRTRSHILRAGDPGFFYTAFTIDPVEQVVVVFMGQLHPTGDLSLDRQVLMLVNQAIVD